MPTKTWHPNLNINTQIERKRTSLGLTYNRRVTKWLEERGQEHKMFFFFNMMKKTLEGDVENLSLKILEGLEAQLHRFFDNIPVSIDLTEDDDTKKDIEVVVLDDSDDENCPAASCIPDQVKKDQDMRIFSFPPAASSNILDLSLRNLRKDIEAMAQGSRFKEPLDLTTSASSTETSSRGVVENFAASSFLPRNSIVSSIRQQASSAAISTSSSTAKSNEVPSLQPTSPSTSSFNSSNCLPGFLMTQNPKPSISEISQKETQSENFATSSQPLIAEQITVDLPLLPPASSVSPQSPAIIPSKPLNSTFVPNRRKSICLSAIGKQQTSIAEYKIKHNKLQPPSVYAKPKDQEDHPRNTITVPYKHPPKVPTPAFDPKEAAIKLNGIKEKIYMQNYLDIGQTRKETIAKKAEKETEKEGDLEEPEKETSKKQAVNQASKDKAMKKTTDAINKSPVEEPTAKKPITKDQLSDATNKRRKSVSVNRSAIITRRKSISIQKLQSEKAKEQEKEKLLDPDSDSNDDADAHKKTAIPNHVLDDDVENQLAELFGSYTDVLSSRNPITLSSNEERFKQQEKIPLSKSTITCIEKSNSNEADVHQASATLKNLPTTKAKCTLKKSSGMKQSRSYFKLPSCDDKNDNIEVLEMQPKIIENSTEENSSNVIKGCVTPLQNQEKRQRLEEPLQAAIPTPKAPEKDKIDPEILKKTPKKKVQKSKSAKNSNSSSNSGPKAPPRKRGRPFKVSNIVPQVPSRLILQDNVAENVLPPRPESPLTPMWDDEDLLEEIQGTEIKLKPTKTWVPKRRQEVDELPPPPPAQIKDEPIFETEDI